MEKTIDQLCQIVGAGGSIKIDASKKTPEQLCKIAEALYPEAKLILTNVSGKTPEQLCDIASSALPGSVIFEL